MSIPLESFPDTGIEKSFRNGWRQLWKYFLILLLVFIVTFLLSSPSSIFGGFAQESEGFGGLLSGLASFAWGILITAPIGYGAAYVALKAARDDMPEVGDLFEPFSNYWNAVLASLLVTVIVIIGLVLFIVPGIIFACKLAFTPYLVVDRRMQVIDAVKESWRMTTGHALKIFLIGLIGIPILLAGLICLLFGVIISMMWLSLTYASLYDAICESESPFSD